MQRTKPSNITDLVGQFLRNNGLEVPLMEHRLLQAWPAVISQLYPEGVGDRIVAASSNLSIYNQTLHVNLTSPALRQQLRMNSVAIVDALNHAAGGHAITAIALH